MKKLFILLLAVATFAIGADVKPFVFENVAQDSATQQEEFEYMLKYKLFGRDYITIGNDVVIKDESGWNGTAGYMTANDRLKLGGPVLVADYIQFKDQPTLTSGPVRAQTYTYNNQNGACINGYVCLGDVSGSKVNHCETGMVYNASSQICADNVPPAPNNLSIPTITWPDTISHSIIFDSQLNGDVKTIVVPNGSDQYDIYLDTIQFKLDHQKLQIEMQDGGRLTRIFVKHFLYHDHGQIQVVYRTDSTNYALSQKDYRGNVIIYTDESISIVHSDNSIMQGTMISTKEIYLACNINFAGQLLANQLRIGDTYNGENFRFVKFDPDTIDVKLDKYGGLRENDSTVVIPIELSDTTDINVYFTYCVELNDGVTIEDFNIPPSFPICNNGESKKVSIPTGSKTPDIPIQINVKVDTLTEPNDILVLKITDISGAILPNGKTDGELKIKIIDAEHSPLAFDTTAVYTFEENKTGVVDIIKVLNKSDEATFTLDSAYEGRYTLDATTGELTLIANPLDFETAEIDYIKVTVNDTGDVSITRTIPITVVDVNEAPVVNDTTITIAENLATGATVGTIVAKDPDTNPAFNTLTYSILETTVPFAINNSGKITVTDGSRINYEKDSVFTFNVRVSDGTYADTATVTIKLTNVKENPHIIDDGKKNYDVNEHEVTDFVIATIKVTDEDAGQLATMNFTIKNTTGADTLFNYTYKVVNDTGNIIISVKDKDKLDYEKIKPVQALNIIVTDADGKKDSIAKTITVKDINEAPVLNDTTFYLSENIPIPSIVGTLKATDVDTTSAFRQNVFTITSGAEYFGIDKTTGRITATKIFNYESDDTVYTLKVKVSDKNDPTLCDSATVTIKIKDTNESPNFSANDTTIFVPENTAPGKIISIPATDEDGDKITYTIIGSVPFTIDSLGNVSSTRPFDYEQETGFTFKVVATDGTLSDTVKINVKVTNVNEECNVNDTTFTINENATGKIGNVNATDKDKDALFGTISYTISDPTNYQIDIDGNVFVKIPLNFEDTPYDTLKVYITDGTFKDTATIVVKVKDVPEDIVISGTVNPVEENVEIGTPVGVITGLDGDSTTVTYTINTPDFKIDQVTGVITTNSNIDYETQNEYPVTVTAKSTDGSTKDTSFVIKVINVNEPVHINDTTLTVPENYTGPIGEIEGKDDDGEPVEYSVRDSINYSIDSLGVITIKNTLDYEQQKTDTLIIDVKTPSGDKDSAIVIINVKNVNETPELLPNDTLTVPENCKNCVIGEIKAVDPDDDPITYKVVEPGFTIDSNGVLTITKPVDYETTPVVTITVIATDPSGAGDTATYTIKVTDVNEPVHTQDTTCSVKENYTGNVCKIPGTDDDGKKPTWIVTDTTNYSIDTTGQLVIKNPIDYEKKTKDTVKVIVTDGEFYDTALVVINVIDEDEKPTITEIDDKPKVDTLKTNDPDHKIDFKICEGNDCFADSIEVTVKKDTTIKVCNVKKTVCDSVVILFNDAPPVVSLTNAKSTNALIDYITIEEQKDDKIYVNKKDNPITVTVKDTVHHTEKKFEIEVTLDTIPAKDIKLKEYNYLVDETKATITPIGGNKAEMTEIIKDNGVDIVITQIIDLTTHQPIDSVQTVTYTKKVGGKDVVVTYKTDNMTGQKIGDYEVSYMIDSCTKVTYAMNDKKQIVKNEEGNIGYTITYDYIDEYGNKATASVDLVYDDIPPKVEILSPYEKDVFKTNAIEVKWTVNGEVQDTLTLQRLEKGVNHIIRRYVDKAGNESADTITVIMKEAKDIDIKIIHPVTEVNQDKVDEYYSEGNKYNPDKPFAVKPVDPKNDTIPDAIGVGFLIDIALPSVSATGGLATLDDIVKNGQIPVDDKGNIVGASTKGIPVEKYVKEHCTAEFQEDYNKNGLNIPLYDVKYYLHLWVWTTTANYVNDFNVEYTLNDQAVASEAGTVQMVIDWLADKNGSVNASNGKALGTSSYITRLYSKSIAKHRCDYKDQVKGEKTVKKEETTKIFGFKRPKK